MDDMFARMSEQYRRESRQGMLVSIDPRFYEACRRYLSSLSAVMLSSDPDSDVRDHAYNMYMSASRLFSDVRMMRAEKICRMAVASVFGGPYDDSCMTDNERSMSDVVRDAVRDVMGVRT